MRPGRRLATTLTGLVLAAAVTAVPTAHATTSGPSSPGGTGTVHGPVRARIIFTKNHRSQWRSTLTWRARMRFPDGTWRLVDEASWRAGSGFGGAGTMDPCAKGRGWLPNGTYSLLQYDDYHGTLIHGRAFRLSDKRCSNGTLREQLFIHTEASAGNGQCADGPGDQVCRWEYPKINDYRSAGCIKLSPHDVADLVSHFQQYFHRLVRYRTSTVSLVVR